MDYIRMLRLGSLLDVLNFESEDTLGQDER